MLVIAPERTGSEADAVLGVEAGNARIALMRTISQWAGKAHVVFTGENGKDHALNPIGIVTRNIKAIEHAPLPPVTCDAVIACVIEGDGDTGEVLITGAWTSPRADGLADQVHSAFETRGIASHISPCCFRMP